MVVVTHDSAAHLPVLAQTLLPELAPDDELLVVDNASHDGTAALARSLGLRVLEKSDNTGFAGGCNAGVKDTRAPLVLLLNPDSRTEQGCIERLRQASAAHPDWGAWQAAVMLTPEEINSAGGVVHFLGIGWAGGCGSSAATLPAGDAEVPFPSGAAMVVRREAWEALGGFDADYFMYGEDLDLGLRLWLAGYAVGIVPGARVLHSYEFDKGAGKWFWLERNRWRTVLSVYPLPLLVLLAPALLAAEAGLVAVALAQGWAGAKLRAQLASCRDLPATLARRRRVQRSRTIAARAFATRLTASLESPYLEGALPGLLARAQALYWAAVRASLKLLRL